MGAARRLQRRWDHRRLDRSRRGRLGGALSIGIGRLAFGLFFLTTDRLLGFRLPLGLFLYPAALFFFRMADLGVLMGLDRVLERPHPRLALSIRQLRAVCLTASVFRPTVLGHFDRRTLYRALALDLNGYGLAAAMGKALPNLPGLDLTVQLQPSASAQAQRFLGLVVCAFGHRASHSPPPAIPTGPLP